MHSVGRNQALADPQSDTSRAYEIPGGLLIDASRGNQRDVGERCLECLDIAGAAELSAGEYLDEIRAGFGGGGNFGGSQSTGNNQSIVGVTERKKFEIERRTGEERRARVLAMPRGIEIENSPGAHDQVRGGSTEFLNHLESTRDRHCHFDDVDPAAEHCLRGEKCVLRGGRADGGDDADFFNLRPNFLPGHRVKCTASWRRYDILAIAMNSKQKIDRRSFLGRGSAAASVLMGATKALTGARNESGEGPVVDTGSGKIRGVVIDKVYAFKLRLSPTGLRPRERGRFMPPVKPQPWTDIKDTTQIGHRSPQQHGILEPLPEVGAADRQNPMGEDCLVVNVWSNGLKGSRKRPVMVWLHGGGFASGSGDYSIYDGANMARKRDVVVVTVNHRLNVFGYLYLADLGGAKYADASNAGHRDIVLALEWVRDNIANFGGDPANVTIFGQSGGGGKVATLMAMPAAKGLFHRAICQSGASIKGMSRENATRTAQGLLTKLNLKPDQLDQLQNMPYVRSGDREAIKGESGWVRPGGGWEDIDARSIRSRRAGRIGHGSTADRNRRGGNQLLCRHAARSD